MNVKLHWRDEITHRISVNSMKQLALDIGLATGPTLENFCPSSNEAALQYLQSWLAPAHQATWRSPVPVYFWGETGSGKTHLLKSVQAALREMGASVGWMDASVFESAEFDENWAAVLMDEVHLYTAEQQHLAFTWFVNAHSFQRPVLCAGDQAPTDLLLREDLRTRLGWGHLFHLQVLGEPERRLVLQKEANARGIVLSDDVVNFMLHRFSRDLGSLMQLLDHLDLYALRTKRAITIPLLKAMLESE